MTHLEAFALKATGSARILRAPVQRVALGEAHAAQGRHVGLTGEGHESRTTWVHVSPEGTWDGHSSGPLHLSRDVFAECANALHACETPPPVDYEHASLRKIDGQPTPAAGYIHDLAIREDGLWALVEFTERAAAMVRAGEYRFCSGVFVWDAPDRKTGETIPCQLNSIGLTNQPFIDGQHAIRLSWRVGALSMKITKKDLLTKLDALVDGDEITEKDLGALIAFMQAAGADDDAIEVEIEEPKEAEAASLAAPPPAMMAEPPVEEVAAIEAEAAVEETDAAAMLITKLAELTGLDNAAILASLEANADSIKAAFLGGSSDSAALTSTVKDQTIAALSRELATHRAEAAKRADAALVAEVDALVAAGKLLPASKPQMVALARKSPSEFRKLAEGLPVVVPLGKDTPAPKAGDSAITTAVTPANVRTHPRFAELSAHYGSPKNPYFRNLPKSGPEREARIETLVLNHISREQPITG